MGITSIEFSLSYWLISRNSEFKSGIRIAVLQAIKRVLAAGKAIEQKNSKKTGDGFYV